MRARGPILSAGRLYCDLVFTGLDAPPAPGREVFADRLDLRAGGGAYITAAYLAHQGMASGLLATLPAAPFDTLVASQIAEAGIRSYCTKAAPSDAPQITVAYPQDADRAFLTRRVGKAIPVLSALPAATHLHIGELTTLLEHPGLLTLARAAGMSVSLDCAWDGAALGRNDLSDIIAAVDLFFPNEVEMAELTRHGVTPMPRDATIVKKGPAGAEYHPSQGTVRSAPAQPAQVRDLTGAGDAFNAGFLTAWLLGQGPDQALENGNRLGAVAVSQIGGFAPDLPITGASTPLQAAGS